MSETSLTFENVETQQEYFKNIQASLDLMIHVTNCTESGLIGSRRFDERIKNELLAFKQTLVALSFKYRYQHSVNNLPSELKYESKESGYPTSHNIREFSMELESDFANYTLDGDIDDLKKRLAVVAMEERRISTNIQAQIALTRYKEIAKEKPCFTLWNTAEIEEIKENHFEALFSHFDSACNMPVVYIIEFINNEFENKQKLSECNESLLRDFKNRASSRLKLLTLFKAMDEQHEWFQPVRLTRAFIGPHFTRNHTMHNDAMSKLFEQSSYADSFGCLTVEQLRVRNFSVETRMFSRSKNTEYDLDRLNPSLYEAGVTSSTQKVVMPYSIYQALTEHESHPLQPYQKYVIGDDGDVLVF